MKRTNQDSVQRISLEMSLKPFGLNDGRSFEECARTVVSAWRPLCEAGKEVSFMLWVADGSDILEYGGNLEQDMEWAHYIGFCNQGRNAYDESHHQPSRSASNYVADPRKMRYRDLKNIIEALRKAGAELLARPITIGATFDPGPEFAESPFKYNRHTEIIVPKRVGGRPTFPMVDATALMHADSQSYASYPHGIPEGEPFALFLGKQISVYCRDLGIDYVWLSNGYGFSALAWDYLGPGFDGETYFPEERTKRLEGFKTAWINLHKGNPSIPMEVRGSNFAAGMDIAKDGVDFEWLYAQDFIRLPPPNSPWGVLNNDYGLEIAGFLSRAVKSPRGEYLFRYYPNDPWFWQNPWTDIFYGQPYDIYVPLATCIINEKGAVTTPSTINFLTVDTEYGETDPLSGVQVAAHIRTALADKPDEVGLVTWIYPFAEYHRLAGAGAEGQAEVFFGDWFVRSAINNGLPVSSVATPEAFDALIGARLTAPQTIAFLPTAALRHKADAERLESWLAKGVPVICYGPAESLHPTIRTLLAIQLDDPLEGELALRSTAAGNAVGNTAGTIIHDPIASAGGIRARYVGADKAGGKNQLLYSVVSGAQERAYCVAVYGADQADAHAPRKVPAPLFWIRGTNPFETRPDKTHLALKPLPRDSKYYDTGKLGYELLGLLGYRVETCCEAPSKKAGQNAALMLFSRHDNAWFLSGYSAAPVGFVKLRFPDGAPVFHATFTKIEDGASLYPLARSMHQECRVFVRQERGIIGCNTGSRDEHHQELTLFVSGLDNAELVFLPPKGMACSFEIDGKKTRFDASQARVSMAGLTGELIIRW